MAYQTVVYVFKIKYEDTLRRMNVPENFNSLGPSLTFKELQAKIREMFQISPSAQFVINYTDKDNDIVTMGNDQDLEDACVMQGLNPLRLDVKLDDRMQSAQVDREQTSNVGNENTGPSISQASELSKAATELAAALKGALPEVTTEAMEAVKRLLGTFEPPRVAMPSGVILEAVEGLVKVVRGHAGSSVQARPTQDQTSSTSIYSKRTSDIAKRNPDGGQSELVLSKSDSSFWGKRENRGALEPETLARIFHKGVQCDGCGMTPIVGPRFRSLKKIDYDLCFSCFSEIGNETDYQRIDRPNHSRRSYYHPPSGLRMVGPPLGPPPPFKPFFSRGPYGWRPEVSARGNASANAVVGERMSGKLDARFVQDVTIFDGSELAPNTCFTKIWRLRNIGTLSWPQQTQLVHVGGDVLGSDARVSLEFPETGIPCDEEIDASVDLVAPERPGRYVSHWRLMAPSGQKFGHRVWVVIQVVPKDEQSPQVQESMFTHHPDAGEDRKVLKEAILVIDGASKGNTSRDEEPLRHEVPATESLSKASDFSEDSIFEISTPVVTSTSQPSGTNAQDGSSMVNSELGGFSMVEKPFEGVNQSPSRQTRIDPSDGFAFVENLPAMRKSLDGASNSDDQITFVAEKQDTDISAPESSSTVDVDLQAIVLNNLLEKLETMGFTEKTLNLELLQKNNNNLQCTLDDLVAASEWDPILQELEEMGFYDTEMNRRLMFKNNGSRKRVVKELVQMQMSLKKGKEKNL